MASHAYLRALAAPSLAPLVGIQPPVRVKLVFLDELATFVTRHRRFSSCWYLIPSTAKLVGDLLHEIAEEFELLERCPQGIEMVLDGFHVLANQEIAMIRDNDTLALQCASFVEEPLSRSMERTPKKTKRSESAQSAEKHAKRRVKKAKTVVSAVEVEKATKSAKKITKTPPSASSSSDDSSDESSVDEEEKISKLAAKKATKQTNRAGGDSSSEDSSSSSEDEQKAPPTPKQRAFKAIVKDTVRKMNEEVVAVQSSGSSSDSSSDSESEAAVPAKKATAKVVKATVTNGKQSTKGTTGTDAAKGTRRRRRPRRRVKGGDAGGTASSENSAANPAAKSKDKSPPAVVTMPPPAQQNLTSKEIRPLRIRGVPPASKQGGGKLHMRFDAPNKAPALPPPGAEREVSADLHKYGPAPVKPRSKHNEVNDEQSENAPTITKKKSVKEMWKRPYEIISSIHDETPTGDASTTAKNKPTLDALLASFPSKPTNSSELLTPSGFHVDDMFAYKTLTLCMETWQPLISEWKCGKVLSLQDNDQNVVLQPHNWILPATTDGKLTWEPSATTESDEAERCIATGEVSELRYLQGLSKDHLAKAS